MSWAPAYATVVDLAAWFSDEPDYDDADVHVALELAIESASRAIDKHCGRQFGRVNTPQIRLYQAEWLKDRWIIDIDDLMTTDGLTVDIDGTQLAEDDYALTPVNAATNGRPWTSIEVLPRSPIKPSAPSHWVRVSAQFGWDSVPWPIQAATLIQAAKFYERRENIGGPLTSKAVDDVRYGWASPGVSSDLDTDALSIVAPFRKLWFAA